LTGDDFNGLTDEQADEIARALGVWRRLNALGRRDLIAALRVLGLKPAERAGVLESICPCCDQPGATWTPKPLGSVQ
jgi:hypothetical protein